jgi:tetratricopeptide (TPR) repeat protein
VIGGGFALLIVLLAGVAGWTSGQRVADTNATATRSADINDQMGRIPGDVASSNIEILEARIKYLATLTPAVPGLADVMQTATAVYLAHQPTPTAPPPPTSTPQPTATLAVTQAAVGATQEITAEATTNGGYDLSSLLDQAQSAVTTQDWKDAIDYLDAIIGIDSTYNSATVRSLMSQALNSYALQLFQNGQTAEAITFTDRAEQFGPLQDGLGYERDIGAVYLRGKAAMNLNFGQAIRDLTTVYNDGPNGRYYAEVQQLLFGQYKAYADSLVAASDFCNAAIQYQNALNIVNIPDVQAKLDDATTRCAMLTATGQPGLLLTPGTPQPIAPVGQVGS